jgi:hypothetical protein
MPDPSYTALGINDHPLVDSWSIDKPFMEPISSEMEGGNVRQRTRAGDETAEMSFTILMTPADLAEWQEFALVDLGRGASRFTMRVWNGSAMVSKTVQLIKGQYSLRPVLPKYAVGFNVRVYGGL